VRGIKMGMWNGACCCLSQDHLCEQQSICFSGQPKVGSLGVERSFSYIILNSIHFHAHL
jgi:hypothetical protein